MESYEVLFLLLKLNWLLFVVAAGCCIGSLTNVIVYRMPRGMSIVTPPSRCPKCGTRLTFRENIPVLGWLILRGKCRYCKAPISPEYPLVEASVGLLFGVFFAFWYMIPPDAVWLGIHWGHLRPEWTLNDWSYVWPTFIVILSLLGSLVAMTLVDAKTSTIPLALCWFPTIVALVAHPVHAAWIQHTIGSLRKTAPGAVWSIPTPGPEGWRWVGAMLGATAGLMVANVLLATGLIRRSFADYEEWERSLNAAAAQGDVVASEATPEPPITATPDTSIPDAGPAQPTPALPESDEAASASPEPVPGPVALKEAASPDPAGHREPADTLASAPEETWIQYPHARREMFKELAFLAPIVGLAMLGWYAANWMGPGPGTAIPLWLRVLTGVLMGYFIGGAVVWGVRIFGSLGFGKEAMGLGDVHLMAAVGACVGWIDATLAFFGAAFVGLFWFALGWLFSGVFKRAMPYGPYLATATVLVLLFKPGVEAALSRLLHQQINLP